MVARKDIWLKMVTLLLVLVLIVPILTACDDDDDDDDKTTAPAVTTPAATTPAATTPAATKPAATTAPPAATLTIDMSIGELLEDPDGEAILRKCIGDEIIDNPQMAMAFGMTVPEVSTMTDKITDETVACVKAGLDALASGTAPAATEVPFVNDPIKVAALFSWSGYGAVASYLADQTIDIVNYQVKQRGGILVGDVKRPLEIVKYDMKSDVSGATQAATKAIAEGCVALAMGGLTGADGLAEAEVAKTPMVLYSHFMGDRTLAEFPNTLNAVLSTEANVQPVTKFALEVLKPKTVAFIAQDSSMERLITDDHEAVLKAAGVETVYKQFYIPGTSDFSPILTRIKFEKPDLVMCYGSMGAYQSMLKQMKELGGWGDINFLGTSQSSGGAAIVTTDGSDGMYVSAYWNPAVENSGTKYWLDSWAEYAAANSSWADKNGKEPSVNILPFYHTLWGIISAIELAGSDNPKDITAAARSGKLSWDSPAGMLTWNKNGESDQTILIGQVQSGKTVVLRDYADNAITLK